MTNFGFEALGSIPGGLNYLGTWDAALNIPLITSGVGTPGQYYIVSVAGNTNIDGISDWAVGDWIIFSISGVWQKIDNSDLEGYNLIQDEGFSLPKQSIIDFQGAGVTATDDPLNSRTVVTIPATVSSVGLTMPSAFNVSSSPVTTSGTIGVTGAGTSSQYIKGDGTLGNSPTYSGGGASVSYYLNGSVNQGVFAGNTYYQMSKTALLVPNADFNIAVDGYVAQFITDVADPNQLVIPAGNWNFELFFSASSSGGTPAYYVELYKYDGASFSLIASNSTNPEGITNGTAIDSYFTALAVPQTTLLATDRLAIRIYVIHSGRTITLHTQNSHLCQIITTFSTGITALNGLTSQIQTFSTGTTGNNFNIVSSGSNHTFNLPSASATSRGALSNTDWTTFNNKQNAISLTTTGSSGASTFIANTLNVPNYTLSGLGGVPTSRNLTINGTTQDLSADRTWSVGTVTSVGLTTGTTGTDVNVSGSPVTGSSSITLNIPTASGTNRGVLSTADWTTFNSKQNAITLTTTGTSGASTLVGATLNIPVYANTNIYNTDGTLTGTRALNLAGNNLSFVDITGLGRFNTLLDDGGGNISELIVEYGGIGLYALGNGTGKYLYISPTSINIAGYYNLPVSFPGLNEIMYASSPSQLGFTSVKTINGNSILGSGNISITGGLTYFTEAQSTAAPNATVNVDSLTAVASTTNADVAIVPKGTGALLTAIPDNTTTGGNKRGANAVDLQTSRSAATQVASGSASIAIGKNNTASGTQSISIGTSATASNTSIALNSNGSVTGSNANGSGVGSIALNGGTASGSWSFSIGRSTASGVNSFAQGGFYSDNTASGDQSVAFGETNISSSYGSASFGLGNTSSSYATFCTGIGSASGSVYGRMCHSSGRVAVAGDSQKSIFTLAQRTTNNTATTLVSYYGAGTTPGTANQVILSNQSAYGFTGTIIGKQSGSTNAAMWKVEGLIVRGANAASTVLTTSTVTLVSNAPFWGTPTLTADTTNGGLRVQVIGAQATNIQWTAVIETTEVIYA